MRYLILLLLPFSLLAESPKVSVSFEEYLSLITAQHQNVQGYSFGKSNLNYNVSEKNKRLIADVQQTVEVKILEDKVTRVPLLPSGTVINNAYQNGSPIQLQNTNQGLVWINKQQGTYNLQLNYTVSPNVSDNGYTSIVPLAPASSISFSAYIPGSGLNLSLLPDTNFSVQESSGGTTVTATLPMTRALQIAWQLPTSLDYTISRASYEGRLEDDAVIWKGEFEVENFTNSALELPLLPNQVTLRNITVNQKKASIINKDNHFQSILPKAGKYDVAVEFQVNVIRGDGPPRINLPMQIVPVSNINLTLPGKKEVTASPGQKPFHEYGQDSTIAKLNLPLTSSVSFSWRDALPDDIKAELRANSQVYQSLYAVEGVLNAKAIVKYEITRGETNLIEFFLPKTVQINQITSTQGGIADWRVKTEGELQKASIFLDRKFEKDFTFEVNYDHSISKDKKELDIPFLGVAEVQRSRGFVALLTTKENELEPKTEKNLTRIGVNQLPAFFHDSLEHKVSHTFKYVSADPVLMVMPKEPIREQGKFNAMVDTLFSIYDVTLRGAATVELNVKSGSINELDLYLPNETNLLSLTGPSIRNHEVIPAENQQKIHVAFNQDMDGQLRLELSYEKIMGEGADAVEIPTIEVIGAEVEQGRIAVEALSAVEVSAASKKELTSLDPSELPKQLILKTTNPILLAYKYVHRDPPFDLKLNIIRHQEIAVQDAVIDTAHYKTLFTKDGIAVTSVDFQVKNSRKQFLKIRLPENSKVWSVFVNGQAEKPALAKGSGEEAPEVLIKVINDTKGFPVKLVYQMPVPKMGVLGRLVGTLPRPDMVVTNTIWDVYVPSDVSYGKVDSDMNIKQGAGGIINTKFASEYRDATGALPVQHLIPTTGKHFSFTKLYANESEDGGSFTIAYTSGTGAYISWLLAIAGTVLFWFGVFGLIKAKSLNQNAIATSAAGAVLLIFLVAYFGMSIQLPVIASVLILIYAFFTYRKSKKGTV